MGTAEEAGAFHQDVEDAGSSAIVRVEEAVADYGAEDYDAEGAGARSDVSSDSSERKWRRRTPSLDRGNDGHADQHNVYRAAHTERPLAAPLHAPPRRPALATPGRPPLRQGARPTGTFGALGARPPQGALALAPAWAQRLALQPAAVAAPGSAGGPRTHPAGGLPGTIASALQATTTPGLAVNKSCPDSFRAIGSWFLKSRAGQAEMELLQRPALTSGPGALDDRPPLQNPRSLLEAVPQLAAGLTAKGSATATMAKMLLASQARNGASADQKALPLAGKEHDSLHSSGRLASIWQSSLGRAAAAGCGATAGKPRIEGGSRDRRDALSEGAARSGGGVGKARGGRRSPRRGSRSAARQRRRRSQSARRGSGERVEEPRAAKASRRAPKEERRRGSRSVAAAGRRTRGRARSRRVEGHDLKGASQTSEEDAVAPTPPWRAASAELPGTGSETPATCERGRDSEMSIRQVLEAARRQLTGTSSASTPERPEEKRPKATATPGDDSDSDFARRVSRLLDRAPKKSERQRKGRRRSKVSSSCGGSGSSGRSRGRPPKRRRQKERRHRAALAK